MTNGNGHGRIPAAISYADRVAAFAVVDDEGQLMVDWSIKGDDGTTVELRVEARAARLMADASWRLASRLELINDEVDAMRRLGIDHDVVCRFMRHRAAELNDASLAWADWPTTGRTRSPSPHRPG